MIVLKKNKPNLKAMFDNYLKEVDKKEKEYNLFDNEYRNYLINKYKREEEEYDDDDYYDMFGYSKSKNWNRTRRILQEYLNTPSIDKKRKNKKHSNKRGKRGGKKPKNKNIIDEDDMMYDAQLDSKTIYFYRDVNNPDANTEIFYSLHDFDNFLTEQGIEISDEEVKNLMTRDISHCCINPDIRTTKGKVQLISDNSYGGLHWQCNDDESYANSIFD